MNQGLDACRVCQIGCGDICGEDMGIASSMFITIHACGQLYLMLPLATHCHTYINTWTYSTPTSDYTSHPHTFETATFWHFPTKQISLAGKTLENMNTCMAANKYIAFPSFVVASHLWWL